MKLFLVRHGEAEGLEKPDEERVLTSQGMESVARIAAHITERFKKPGHLYVSPLIRAQQTAEHFASRWDIPPETVEWLRPATSASAVLEQLNASDCDNVLIGHLPNLGLILGSLVLGMPAKEVVLPKGGVALLEVKEWDVGKAKLRWLLTSDTI